MLRFSHFVQECPVCGRPLEIRVKYVGGEVACRHCGGTFQANDEIPSDEINCPDPAIERGNQLLRLADQLLERSRKQLGITPEPAVA